MGTATTALTMMFCELSMFVSTISIRNDQPCGTVFIFITLFIRSVDENTDEFLFNQRVENCVAGLDCRDFVEFSQKAEFSAENQVLQPLFEPYSDPLGSMHTSVIFNQNWHFRHHF